MTVDICSGRKWKNFGRTLWCSMRRFHEGRCRTGGGVEFDPQPNTKDVVE